MSNEQWTTVTKRQPCPICQHDSWCVMARDGSSVICMRKQEACVREVAFKSGETGYLHADFPSGVTMTVDYPASKPVPKLTTQQVEKIHAGYRGRLQPFEAIRLAEQLGVSSKSLYALRIGQSNDWDHMKVFAFPMEDREHKMIGISFRREDGKRWSEKGGRNGLFVPDAWSGLGPLLIVEGPTDTAALFSLGYDVIGRPSCSSGGYMLKNHCNGRDVVIVADDDTPDKHGHRPGLAGAIKLAEEIGTFWTSSTKIITPVGAKDARAWINDGATRGAIDFVIGSASYYCRARVPF